MEERLVDYKKGYVFELMAQGGPTDNREPYFKDAVVGGVPAKVIKMLDPAEQKE